MNIAIVGSGYVGLTSSICFASKGHNVTCIDVIKEKIDMINSGKSPIYENGMEELLNQVLKSGNLKATIDAKTAINNAEIVFICVGTPSKDDETIDLKYIKMVAQTISENLNNYKTIVVKSTVIPETTLKIVKPILEKSNQEFGICMNPELLKEGTAIKDFLSGDRIVLGVDSKKTEEIMKKLYKDFPQKIFITNPTTAEMIKYTNNSLLATKISFANEIGNLCKKLKINSFDVMDGVGLDNRISRKFLNSGCGFGGSCFPKDVKAILHKGLSENEPMTLLKSVLTVNDNQAIKMIKLLQKHIPNLNGKTIGLLGLAFKPGTDDIREAPSLIIINSLLNLGAKIIATDNQAINNIKKIYGEKIKLTLDPFQVKEKSDALLIVTEWDNYKKEELYSDKIVIDGRNIIEAKSKSRIYEGICWN